MEFSELIQKFAEKFGLETPEIVDDAAAFDADGHIWLQPEEGGRIPHWSTLNENDLMSIAQPRTNEGWRFELKVDDKNKTATLILKANYAIRPSPNMRNGELGQDRATKVGLHVTTCEFQITGLGSGNPQIASLGVRQDIEAEEM